MTNDYEALRRGSANDVSVAPDGMTTYCRPSMAEVVGGVKIAAPVWN